MILLKKYSDYWRQMVRRVPGLKSAMMVTIEQGMGDRIQRMTEEQSPALFYLPPSSETKGSNPDTMQEQCRGVIFVMAKFNQRTSTSVDALIDTQPAVEAVKAAMVSDGALPCGKMRVDIDSIDTLAETSFYAGWAGWSVGFTFTELP